MMLKHKSKLSSLVLVFSMLAVLFVTVQPAAAPTQYYDVRIEITYVSLYFDGDTDCAWWCGGNNPGEIRIFAPNGEYNLGTHEDSSNPTKIVTATGVVYTAKVSQGSHIYYQMKDHDGGSSYTTLWSGSVQINGEADTQGPSSAAAGYELSFAGGNVKLKTTTTYDSGFYYTSCNGYTGSTTCLQRDVNYMYFKITSTEAAPDPYCDYFCRHPPF